MYVVKTATVRVVRPHELKVGDEILWSTLRLKVLEIDARARPGEERFLSTVLATDADFTQPVPRYATFYVIESYEEVWDDLGAADAAAEAEGTCGKCGGWDADCPDCRDTCKTCWGSGTVSDTDDIETTCPDCGGTGVRK